MTVEEWKERFNFPELLHKAENSNGHSRSVCHALAQLNETDPKHYPMHIKRCKNLVLQSKFMLQN